MGALIAQGLCCCFSCCCQGVSDALQRWLGPQKVTKIFYLFLVVIFTVPAIVVLFFLNKWDTFTSKFDWLVRCPESSGGG